MTELVLPLLLAGFEFPPRPSPPVRFWPRLKLPPLPVGTNTWQRRAIIHRRLAELYLQKGDPAGAALHSNEADKLEKGLR